MDAASGWQRWLWPLRSRKVQMAIATIVVAWAAQAGVQVSEEMVLVVVSVGVAVILGIAIEDGAQKFGGYLPGAAEEEEPPQVGFLPRPPVAGDDDE